MTKLMSKDPKLKVVLKEFPVLVPGSVDVFFNDAATTKIYTTHNTLSLLDALPISCIAGVDLAAVVLGREPAQDEGPAMQEIEEHTSELQSLCVISYAVFCLKK